MKAILEFNLPEDTSDHTLAVSAGEMFSTLCDIREYIRSRIKYGEVSIEVRTELESVRDMLPHDLMERIP